MAHPFMLLWIYHVKADNNIRLGPHLLVDLEAVTDGATGSLVCEWSVM